jgi:hypothetical protein
VEVDNVVSPWHLPFPKKKHYQDLQVVICSYDCGKWFPIMACNLTEAIIIHNQVLLLGEKVFIFPLNCYPDHEDTEKFIIQSDKKHRLYAEKTELNLLSLI